MPSKDELKILQALPLELKVRKTQERIREWVNYYGEDGVYVSFSGGKDSTVLLHIVRDMYPNIEAVFVNTGLEYPEIQSFVKSFDNVTILRPKMRFDEVIHKYGYPFISKDVATRIYYAQQGNEWAVNSLKGLEYDGHYRENSFKQRYKKYEPLMNVDFKISHRCCGVMKEKPLHALNGKKQAFVATLADESDRRKKAWIKTGCNAFEIGIPVSKPLSFWTEQDVLRYIKENDLLIASVYGEVVEQGKGNQMCIDGCGKLKCTGCNRTGCIFCQFGSHLTPKDEESPLQRLKRTHPKQYDYCMNGGAYDTDGLWKPTKEGLGMKHCIDVLNDIYGKDFIRY